MDDQDPLPRWTLGATAGLMLLTAAAILLLVLTPALIPIAIVLVVGVVTWAVLERWGRPGRGG